MKRVSRREALGMTAAMAGAAGVVGSGLTLSGCASAGEVYEPGRAIPVLTETDVLVLGGGPAGMSAAIAASRAGADVVLVERYGSFGGVITQQTMGSIAWFRFAETIDAGGLRLEYEQKAREVGATLDVLGEEGRGVVSDELLSMYHDYLEDAGLRVDGKPTFDVLETELFKWVADELLRDSGVTPLLHCWAVDAWMEGRSIAGVITESKSGRRAILAKRVIDCTGDADVAWFAGAPLWQSEPHELMESTMQFGMSNVDLQTLLLYIFLSAGGVGDWSETGGATSTMLSPRVVEPYEKARAAGEIPADDDIEYTSYFGAFTAVREIPDMNTVHLPGVDPTDVWALTDAEFRGRAGAMRAMAALKKYCPGFEEARIRTLAPALGVREARHIVGAYTVTENDVRNQARFDDSIGICPEFLDGFGLMILPTSGRYFHVPYRCLVPDDVENLLVAGRAIAGDRMAHTATRQMACCCVTGQAAGVAAAVSLGRGETVREVEVAAVQAELVGQGVRID